MILPPFRCTVFVQKSNRIPIVSNNNSDRQVFLTRIQLKKFVLPVRGEYQLITPGMSATGEIVMREKSVLSLLLDPITRQVDEVFSVK